VPADKPEEQQENRMDEQTNVEMAAYESSTGLLNAREIRDLVRCIGERARVAALAQRPQRELSVYTDAQNVLTQLAIAQERMEADYGLSVGDDLSTRSSGEGAGDGHEAPGHGDAKDGDAPVPRYKGGDIVAWNQSEGEVSGTVIEVGPETARVLKEGNERPTLVPVESLRMVTPLSEQGESEEHDED
jgi:hypothetical protein